MAAPAYSFVRTMVQTRARGHHALAAMAYRLALNVAADDGREWHYARRGGVAASGAALPDGAAKRWKDPVLWAGEIETSERRKDSRLFRDDVIGVPLELVAAGKAYEAIGEYARRLSQLRRTPVHFAMHCPPRSDSVNWHAHVVYAGRQLTADGQSFARKRDRRQDRAELIDEHKAIWSGVCAEYGVELDFSGPVSEQPLAHLGPQAAGIERTSAQRETAKRLAAAIRETGGQVDDVRELASAAQAAHAGETISELLVRDRAPATTAARRASHPKPSRRAVREHACIQLGEWTPPVLDPDDFSEPVPARLRPRAREDVNAPLVVASELPRASPAPARMVTRPRPGPAADVNAPLVVASELPRASPAPVRMVTRPRPGPAADVNAPLVVASELPRASPAPVRMVTRPRPGPAADVNAPLVVASELPRASPAPVRMVTRPRPGPAADVNAPLVVASELPRASPAPVRMVTRPRPGPAADVNAPLVVASELPRASPAPVRMVTRPRPGPAADVNAPLVVASELPRASPAPVRMVTRPRPGPAADVNAPLIVVSELPRASPAPVRMVTRPRPGPAADVNAPLVVASELPRASPARMVTRPRPGPAADVDAPLIVVSELPRASPAPVRMVTRPRPGPAADVNAPLVVASELPRASPERRIDVTRHRPTSVFPPDNDPLDYRQFQPTAVAESEDPEVRDLVTAFLDAESYGSVIGRFVDPATWDDDADEQRDYVLISGGSVRYRGMHSLRTIVQMRLVRNKVQDDDGSLAASLLEGGVLSLSRQRDMARGRER